MFLLFYRLHNSKAFSTLFLIEREKEIRTKYGENANDLLIAVSVVRSKRIRSLSIATESEKE